MQLSACIIFVGALRFLALTFRLPPKCAHAWGMHVSWLHPVAQLLLLCVQSGQQLWLFDGWPCPIMPYTLTTRVPCSPTPSPNSLVLQFTLKWGSPGFDLGQLDNPTAIAIDRNNDVVVADTFNHRIVRHGADGSSPFAWGSFGEGSGTDLNYPFGLAINSQGHVLVADTFNSRIKRFDSSGLLIAMWGYHGPGEGQLSLPSGLAVDLEDVLYVVRLQLALNVEQAC